MGIILQLIVIISVLPVVQLIGNYDETLVLVIAYLLVICPIITLIVIKLWINWKGIENTVIYLRRKYYDKFTAIRNDDTDETAEVNENVDIVDDSPNKNALPIVVNV